MVSMRRPRLRAVQAHQGAVLELTFVDGQRFILNMSQDLKNYPGLEPLVESREFQGVVLGDSGWTVEWPKLDIQIGADSLYLDALKRSPL